jgi:xylose isomerase
MEKDRNGTFVHFFRLKLTSSHVIGHLSTYLCDTCPQMQRQHHVSVDIATIFFLFFILRSFEK